MTKNIEFRKFRGFHRFRGLPMHSLVTPALSEIKYERRWRKVPWKKTKVLTFGQNILTKAWCKNNWGVVDDNPYLHYTVVLHYITFRLPFFLKAEDLRSYKYFHLSKRKPISSHRKKDKIILGSHVYKEVIKSSSCSEIFREIFPLALNCLHEGGQGRLTLWLRKHLISTRKKIENSESYMKN